MCDSVFCHYRCLLFSQHLGVDKGEKPKRSLQFYQLIAVSILAQLPMVIIPGTGQTNLFIFYFLLRFVCVELIKLCSCIYSKEKQDPCLKVNATVGFNGTLTPLRSQKSTPPLKVMMSHALSPQGKVPPRPLTPCSPKSTVPLGWLPPLNCKLNYYSMALGWISQRLRPKVNGTVELDTTLKCTPLPKVNATVGLDFTPPSQRQRWGCSAVLPSSPSMAAWCPDLEMHA